MATVETRFTTSGVSETVGATDKVAKGFSSLSGSSGGLSSSLDYLKTSVVGVVSAMSAWAFTKYIEGSAMLAARVETLGAVMQVVGNNAGYTSSQIDMYAQQVQKMGITTKESMDSTIKMASSKMDLAKATQLARVAQDAATIGQVNSSEAFGRMIDGIRSGEVEILKTLGLNVNFEQSYEKMARQLGKTSKDLTETEKVAARMNATLDFGKNIAGAYEAAMGTAGKQMTSLARPAEEIKLSLGSTFTPALNDSIRDLYGSLNYISGALKNNKEALQDVGFWFKYAYFVAKTAVLELVNTFYVAAIAANKFGGAIASALYLLQGGSLNSSNPFKGAVKWFEDNVTGLQKKVADINSSVSKSWDSLANYGTGGRTSAQEQASFDAAAARKAQEAADARKKAAEAGKQAAEQWRATYADLRREIAALNPAMDEYAKKIADTNNKYTDLEHKKGADIVLLKQLRAEHLAGIEMRKQINEGIALNKTEMEEFRDAAEATAAFEKQYWLDQAAALKSLDQMKAAQIGKDLALVNAQEKFYQITPGEAAQKRIALLQQELTVQQSIFDDIKGNEPAANLLRAQTRDKLAAVNAQLLEQQIILRDRSALGGMTVAIQKYGDEATNVGKQVETVFTNAFKNIEDAITNMVQHGKLDIKSLLDAIQADVTRMTIAKPITNYLASGIGNMAVGNYTTGNTTTPQGTNPVTGLPISAGGGTQPNGIGAMGMIGLGLALNVGMTTLSATFDSLSHSGEAAAENMRRMTENIKAFIGDLNARYLQATGQGFEAQKVALQNKQTSEMNGTLNSLYDLMGTGSKGYADNLVAIWKQFTSSQIDQMIKEGGINRGLDLDSSFGKAIGLTIESIVKLTETQAEETKGLNATLYLNRDKLKLQELELMGLKDSTEYMATLANIRTAEMYTLDDTEKAIQAHIYALQDEADAVKATSTAIGKTVDIAISAANAMRDIQSSSLSTDSPMEQLRKAKEAWDLRTPEKAGELGKSYLTALQGMYASGAEYQAGYLNVMSALQAISGTPVGTTAERQLTVLESIRDLLKENNYSAANAAYNALPTFALGGITNGPSIAGEGMYREAVIPLPDGRTVNARVNGMADNKGIEDRLDKAIRALESMDSRMAELEESARLDRNKPRKSA